MEEVQKASIPLSEEELKALTDDLQEVLIKHNAEMGVTSSINLMKVVDVQPEVVETKADAKENSSNGEAKKGS